MGFINYHAHQNHSKILYIYLPPLCVRSFLPQPCRILRNGHDYIMKYHQSLSWIINKLGIKLQPLLSFLSKGDRSRYAEGYECNLLYGWVIIVRSNRCQLFYKMETNSDVLAKIIDSHFTLELSLSEPCESSGMSEWFDRRVTESAVAVQLTLTQMFEIIF